MWELRGAIGWRSRGGSQWPVRAPPLRAVGPVKVERAEGTGWGSPAVSQRSRGGCPGHAKGWSRGTPVRSMLRPDCAPGPVAPGVPGPMDAVRLHSLVMSCPAAAGALTACSIGGGVSARRRPPGTGLPRGWKKLRAARQSGTALGKGRVEGAGAGEALGEPRAGTAGRAGGSLPSGSVRDRSGGSRTDAFPGVPLFSSTAVRARGRGGRGAGAGAPVLRWCRPEPRGKAPP